MRSSTLFARASVLGLALTTGTLATGCADDPVAPAVAADTTAVAFARRSSRANDAPVATIVSPDSGARFAKGASITFTGSGSDREDGALGGSSLVWRSSRDGRLGTGRQLARSNLSVGTHTITLTATDSRGATGTDSRSIVVEDSAPTTTTTTTTTTGTDTTSTSSPPSDTTTTTTTTTSPPPDTSGGEPSGMSVLVDRDWGCVFSTSCDSGWSYSPNITTGLSLTLDATAPQSSPTVAQMTYPAGFSGGSGPGIAERGFSTHRQTIYISTSVKFSSNWQGHSSGVNKILYFGIDNGSPKIYTSAKGSGTGALVPEVALQSLNAAYYDGVGQTATTVNLLPNVTKGKNFERGKWHRVEYLFIANSPGVADGRVQVWIDGVQTHSYTGIQFVGSAGKNRWEWVKWSPVWGGTGGTVASTMYQQMDHLYISGK